MDAQSPTGEACLLMTLWGICAPHDLGGWRLSVGVWQGTSSVWRQVVFP